MNKNVIIAILSTFIITIGGLYYFGFINENIDDEIKDLSNQITKLEEENKKLEEDKLFYKNNYIDMAQEYEDRLHELGIEEYILTDTGR